jgi:hypothetical protein
VIVSDSSDWWQTVLVLFRSDQLGLATTVSACLDIRLELALIPGTTLMKNMPIYILCTGFATVTPLHLSRDIGYDVLEDESPTDVCSLVFTRVHQHL